MKPLIPAEVPEQFRTVFDFGSQEFRARPGRGRRLHVQWTCIQCSTASWKEASTIRYAITHGKFTGLCRRCYAAGLVEHAGLVRHGLSRHPLYGRWVSIKGRCLNPSSRNYPDYGGRGIRVFPEWSGDDPRPFITWVLDNLGLPPSAKHQLDRIDNNGNYEPGNLRWATPSENQRNKRPMTRNAQLSALQAEVAALRAEVERLRGRAA